MHSETIFLKKQKKLEKFWWEKKKGHTETNGISEKWGLRLESFGGNQDPRPIS